MKHFDFKKGFINESTQSSGVVNEFFGTFLVVAALGFMASKSVFDIFAGIQEKRAKWMEYKAEREKQKAEYLKAKKDAEAARIDMENEKEERKKAEEEKKHEAQLKESMRTVMAYENAVNSMDPQDSPEALEAKKKLEAIKGTMKGTASAADIKTLEKEAKASLPPEAQKIVGRIQKSVVKISDAEVEAEMKKQGITLAALNAGVDKVIKEETPKEQEVDKTDDEIKQEIKDKYGEEDTEVPENLKDKDGKLDPAKVDALDSENLKKVADTAGIKTTKRGKSTTPDEEWVDDDGTKYTKIGDKYTMTKTNGETKELSQQEYEDHIENDDVTDAKRTDNDDNLEDEDEPNQKDPHKVFKQRTYKRGNRTFKTKSYYDKKGNSITKDEFQKRVENWKKTHESFICTVWKMTRPYETRKHTHIIEAKQSTDMESICKERLVYIKYVMDSTTNSVEKTKMKRIYNAIYNCCFDANGKARSIEDLYTYLNETMIENKGSIPGLPTNDQIMNIDDKCAAWRKMSPDKFDAYMASLNKELLDKTGTKKSDKAKDLLSSDNTDSNTQTLEKIRNLSMKYGFTNILGLEPTRKASKQDDEKKDEIQKQKKDGSPNANTQDSKDVNADDISSEQIDKIIGVTK